MTNEVDGNAVRRAVAEIRKREQTQIRSVKRSNVADEDDEATAGDDTSASNDWRGELSSAACPNGAFCLRKAVPPDLARKRLYSG